MMDQMRVTISDDCREFVEAQAAAAGLGGADEYVARPLRGARRLAAREVLEQKLLGG